MSETTASAREIKQHRRRFVRAGLGTREDFDRLSVELMLLLQRMMDGDDVTDAEWAAATELLYAA